MAKLWGGRFKKGLDEVAKDFSYSLSYDSRLFSYDIFVNRVHARALNMASYLTPDELSQIEDTLDQLQKRYDEDPESLWADDEDVHSCIERHVTEMAGDVGKKLHTGKSRNDQVITDVRLFLINELEELIDLTEALMKTLWTMAGAHLDIIFPGFTHLQVAQPVLLSHHLLAYFEKFSRDRGRLIRALESADVCPLGSGAMSGNCYGLDREMVARELGFGSVTRNSMDAVSDRDFILEFLSASSIIMTHLSRFSEELIIWSSSLVDFIEIGDDYTTGSSIMPQKKNPDIAELVRGKSGRVLGHMVSLIHTLKSLPLTYNRDLQEDKELLFDTVDTLHGALTCFNGMLKTIIFKETSITASMKKGFILATDFADYLVRKGVPFREAHEQTGSVVLYAEENNKQLEELTLEELQGISSACEEDVLDIFSLQKSVDSKDVLGGTATVQVQAQLNAIQEVFKW